MNKVLDMQFIRYANLFENVTRIKTNHCFEYNHTVIFVVPRKLVMRAIGPNNENLRKLGEIIGKKVNRVCLLCSW
jgi:transcription antitermination factor NusA-like protein